MPPSTEATDESEDRSHAASRAAELQMARANRDVTGGLAGTCIAVLTFALFFLFDRARSGAADMTLFQIALVDLVGAEALISYAGICYAWQVTALSQGRPAGALEQWGGSLLGIGMLAMSLAPALILFTVDLFLAGAVALATWLVIPLAVILRHYRLGSRAPRA